MATQFIGKNRGAARTTITTGTSTTGKSLELTVDLTAGWKRSEIIVALEELEDYILDTRTTPFAQ
jgi:hypothetical protein